MVRPEPPISCLQGSTRCRPVPPGEEAHGPARPPCRFAADGSVFLSSASSSQPFAAIEVTRPLRFYPTRLANDDTAPLDQLSDRASLSRVSRRMAQQQRFWP